MQASTNPNNLDLDCNWKLGFNVDPSGKGTIGYLLTWNGCGGLNLASDITVWNPYTSPGQTVVSGTTVQCIGILEWFKFDGGDTDPIRLKCYVSRANAAAVRSKLSRPISNTAVNVGWYIVRFDEDDKAWYEATFPKNTPSVEANIDTMGGNLQLFIDVAPTKISETLDVNVYGLEFQIVPAEGVVNQIEFAGGVALRQVRSWGEEEE